MNFMYGFCYFGKLLCVFLCLVCGCCNVLFNLQFYYFLKIFTVAVKRFLNFSIEFQSSGHSKFKRLNTKKIMEEKKTTQKNQTDAN